MVGCMAGYLNRQRSAKAVLLRSDRERCALAIGVRTLCFRKKCKSTAFALRLRLLRRYL